MRAETGALRFEGDCTGVFVRGDDALYYGTVLRDWMERTLPPSGSISNLPHSQLLELSRVLLSCKEPEARPMELRGFVGCVKDGIRSSVRCVGCGAVIDATEGLIEPHDCRAREE